jgi:mono/diheme cytochrome c family protein
VVPIDRVKDIWTDATNEPYASVVDGGDYWLSAGEPKCADCHKPPFVESLGGSYFPVDQEGKYSHMRYSKGHQGLACQSCHQSIHGLFPANPLGPDPTTYKQATLLNPDGTAGPVKCAACHVVDAEGVPTNVNEAMFVLFPDDEYPTRYDKAVGLSHILRDE